MMKKLLTTVLCVGIFSFGLLPMANAALEVRLGGKAVYDTDRDITWLANANAAQGSIFDDGVPNDGWLSWESAKNWAASLNIEGVAGWRLPSARNSDGSGPSDDPEPGIGLTYRDSEMGHLFYKELSGTTKSPILGSGDPDLSLFSNIQLLHYWTGTSGRVGPFEFAWTYTFDTGKGGHVGKEVGGGKAWAVHDGDVALIPEPQTYAMMLAGLLAIFSFGKLKRQNY